MVIPQLPAEIWLTIIGMSGEWGDTGDERVDNPWFWIGPDEVYESIFGCAPKYGVNRWV